MHIKFRPHHFLCTYCFQGKGYSATFLQNYISIVDTLDNANTPIEIIAHSDDICSPCPHNTGQTCASENKIKSLDRAHANALHVRIGEVITWNDAQEKIQKHISLDTFHQICDGCEWKPLGICEEKIRALQKIG